MFWRRTLNDGEIGEGDLAEAMSLMKQHNALSDTMDRARHYGAIARDALAIFPDGPRQGGAARGHRFLRRSPVLGCKRARRRSTRRDAAAASSAAARLASSSVANSAKQVGPLPESLARRTPSSAESAASTPLISGTRFAAGTSRSLPRGSA